MPALENITQLNSSIVVLQKNQTWMATVKINDLFNETAWMNSANITILNAQPSIAGITNIVINETELINITINLSDIDLDSINYTVTSLNNISFVYYNNTNYSIELLWNTTLNDSGTYIIYVTADDGMNISEMMINITILNARDLDGDGIADFLDEDDDNDGLVDDEDRVIGGYGSGGGGCMIFRINSTVNHTIRINNTANYSQNLTSTNIVAISESASNDTILEFEWNFTHTLDLARITVNISNISGYSAVRISGLDIAAQNRTKTAYIEKTSGNSVCIIDSDGAQFSSISSGCTNTSNNETLVLCDGVLHGNYTCTNTGSRYKIEGLRHSLVKEFVYIPQVPVLTPARTSGGGGGGGGGMSIPKNTSINTTANTTSNLSANHINNITANATSDMNKDSQANLLGTQDSNTQEQQTGHANSSNNITELGEKSQKQTKGAGQASALNKILFIILIISCCTGIYWIIKSGKAKKHRERRN